MKMEDTINKIQNMFASNDINKRTEIYLTSIMSSLLLKILKSKNKPYQKFVLNKTGNLEDDKYFSGNYYVYIWMHMNGEVFYVGKGHNKRYANVQGRPDGFMEHLEKRDIEIYIPFYNMSESAALLLERKLIEELSKNGHPLVNIRYHQQLILSGQSAALPPTKI